MTVFFQSVRRVAVAAALCVLCVLGTLSAGCQDAPEIRLVPVFPADEPDLLQRAGVVRLQLQPVSEVDPETGEKTNEDPAQTLVEQGEGFSLRLPRGRWSVMVEGVDDGGNVVVYGKTPTFEVARGQGGTVKLFVGRSMAFNLVELQPPEVAAALEGLREHAVTAFDDAEGHPWILVTGGRQPNSPDEPVALALLIDPVSFTIEQLPSLSCARSGHTSFAVQTPEEGPRVVLAGGDEQSGACRSSLDVYDPISRTFLRIDPFGADDRVAVAVPEITKEGLNSVHTGRVIVPGNPRVGVDLLSGQIETGDPNSGPSDIQLAAKNSGEHILILTADTLYVDEANVGATFPECFDDEWNEAAVFGPVEERNRGLLHALADERFLYIGGLAAGGGETEFGWSLISIGSCEVASYTEGRRLPGPMPTHGFALIDLLPQGEIGLLLTGGWNSSGEPDSKVVLLTKTVNASVPTFHELSSGHYERTIALRSPRAGHAAVRLAHDGTWWLIGGGDDARPEIFVRAQPLEPTPKRFERRSPPLTSMTVVDTTPGTAAFNSDVATAYPAELYAEQARFSTVVFVTAAADRGIKDGAFAPAVNSELCDEISEPSYKLVVSGVVPNQDQLEEGYDAGVVDVIPYEGGSNPPPATLEKAVDKLADLADDENGCSWRQLLKVGLDGLALTQPGGDFDPGVPVRLGVNVLVMVTSGDDCSQNVYGQGTPPDEVSEFHCVDPAAEDAFDEYFGLPPFGDFEAEFSSLLDGITWDDSDLIVAVMGNTSHDDPADCDAGGYGEFNRPRRLIETVDYVEETLGAQAQLVDVCGGGDKPALVQALEAVGDRIRKQNPLQACVPVGITDVEPDIEDDMLVAVQPHDDKAQLVKQDVSARCWVVYWEYAEPPELSETDEVLRGVALPDSAWRIATNFDGRAEGTDCDWIVRLDPFEDENGKDVDNAELVCLP